ncbi:MAG: aromatic acid exporter family protein [Microcoleaceae cyanobacterium]
MMLRNSEEQKRIVRSKNQEMISVILRTTLKVGLGTAIAWVIADTLGFSTALFAAMFCQTTILLSLGIAWYLVTRILASLGLVLMVSVIILVCFGKSYIGFFLATLLTGIIWNYLKNHGVFGNLLAPMIMLSATTINSNTPDPVGYCSNLAQCVLIGVAVGILINRLFWPTMVHQGLRQQFAKFLDSSQKLTETILQGHLQESDLIEDSHQLQKNLIKNVQSSQKMLKIGMLDPTGRQLGNTNWSEIIQTKQQITLHLSAIFDLIQASQKIHLFKETESELKKLFESILEAFSEISEPALSDQYIQNLSQLKQEFNQFKTRSIKFQEIYDIQTLPLAGLLRFYSLIHRLEKLINEIIKLGEIKLLYEDT